MAIDSARPILLIEDDPDLCALMIDFFAPHGLQVESASDGREGLTRALNEDYQLIILDVMLPIIDGFEILRQIRKRSDVPIIMLTARTGRSDRIAGLDHGADDYLPKPFEPDELLARIRAILRRSGRTERRPQALVVANLKLDPRSRILWRNGETVTLTPIQFDILEALMRGAGRIVSRDEISTILHQRPSTPYERSLDVHISHLRKKIAENNGPMIQAIRGKGYLLTAGGDDPK